MAQKIILLLILFGFLVAVFKLKNLVLSLSIFRYRIVYAFLIPALLFSMWVFFSVREIYHVDNVLLQLTTEYGQGELENPDFTELIKGKKITGKFTAKENNLGIIAVRFWNFFRLNDDYVIFRVKETSQLDWYYQNIHKVDQFQPHGLFPFGFPIIPDSAGKTYVFEVESTAGSSGNAIGLSPIEPVFVARFKYPRSKVTTSVSHALYFFSRKFVSLLLTPRFVASSFIYFLPLLLYILYFQSKFSKAAGRAFINSFILALESRAQQFDEGKDLPASPFKRAIYRFLIWISLALANFLKDKRTNPRVSMFLVYLAITLDVFWVRRDDTTVILLIILWAVLVKIYQLSLKTTYITALILFIVSLITWYQGDVNIQFISERALAWSFLFVTLAAIQMTLALRDK